ncbi:MAG: efflux RND transporter periplasmic adaptor subunit [Candidatus Pacebacteria bacterium]|nr:efflux RND transporter periplasmic adaptor subunit [Candidatus Paceibacterota bacterium]
MSKIFSSISKTSKKLLKTKTGVGIIVAFVVLVCGYLLFFRGGTTYQFVTVEKGSIVESVSLTGNTTPTQDVSLSFGSSGTISHIYSDLGKQVYRGQVLAELNTSDLIAQLRQAEATVDAQQARLDGLQNGSRPEDINLAQIGLTNAKIDLENTKAQQATLVANAHRALLNSSITAYSTINTGTTASTATAPTISGTYEGDAEGLITVDTVSGGEGYFNASGLVSGTGPVSTNSVPLGTSGLYISFPAGYNIGSGASWKIPMPNTQASTYITNLNLYNSALTTESTTVAQKEAVVTQKQAELDLKNAGSLSTDISAQEAQVEQAKASVQSVLAKLENAQIVAPISGTITQFDAKIGQLASPNVPLVSIMSDAGYEVDAGVSETDIGKVSVGDTVTMTLDAFFNETFEGSVFYIAPAETNTQGVVNYKIKISFSKPDPRLKSGLTANIEIQTKHKDNVLILPQYAILQDDQGTFVKTFENNQVKQNPVTLGIQDQKGNVEVTSGVTLGEQVINIGLKAQ